jgi:hypothetical protein
MQSIKRGILQSFDPSTYTASCLLLEATSNFLTGVPISTSVDAATAIAGAYCAVYPNGSQGVPAAIANGLITFVTPAAGNSNFLVNNGTTSTINLFGSGIPNSAKAVLLQVQFTSPSVNARIQLAPHGGNLNGYMIVGGLYAANQTLWATAILPVDVNGQVDVFAAGGNCTVTVWTYGYVS